MSPLRPTHAEEDLAAFLAQFAEVRTCDQKTCWRWERACLAAFVGDRAEKPRTPYYANFAFRQPRVLQGAGADEAYREVCATPRCRYVVMPEEPATVAFECEGSLPPLAAWQGVVDSRGLPFDIALADAELSWTFVTSREAPEG